MNRQNCTSPRKNTRQNTSSKSNKLQVDSWISRDSDGLPSLPRAALYRAQDDAWNRGETRQSKAQFFHQNRVEYSREAFGQTSDNDDNDQEELDVRDIDTVLSKEELNELQPSPGFSEPKTGARRSVNDPWSAKRIIQRMVKSLGWSRSITAAEVLMMWPEIAGPRIAQCTTAESFHNGTLTVRATTTAYANAIRWEIPRLMGRCDEMLDIKVEKLIVLTPKQPSWKHGPYSVPGPGPRDTYG